MLFYCGTLYAFQKHVIISYLQALSNKKHVHSVRVIPSKQHMCRYNSTEEDKDSKSTKLQALANLIHSLGNKELISLLSIL